MKISLINFDNSSSNSLELITHLKSNKMSAQQFKAEIETIINKVREGFTNRSVFATDEQFNEAVYVAAAEKSGFIAKFVAGEYVVFTKENAKKLFVRNYIKF